MAPILKTHALAARRGFTLIEAMVVVMIVGILAVLATYSVRKYVSSSKTSEAIEMIGAIKAAQESYKDETFGYFDVSQGNYADYYPANSNYGRDKVAWGGTATAAGSNGARWSQLGLSSPGAFTFVFACVANNDPTSTPAAPPAGDITIGSWPSAALGKPWYVVEAKADFEGNGIKTVFVGTSFTGDLFSAND
ncbi:MAG TPA: prepilin-type N-terminal cleavage/methylation domain-containing protein [Polyangiaceae bacterium]